MIEVDFKIIVPDLYIISCMQFKNTVQKKRENIAKPPVDATLRAMKVFRTTNRMKKSTIATPNYNRRSTSLVFASELF